MILNLHESELKNGVLSLVVALVEIIKETLRLQAVRRMEGGSLTEAELQRLGEALMELDAAIQQIKVELGVAQSVQEIRDGLDRTVSDVVASFLGSGSEVKL